jgi:hypothetical protein
MKNIVVIFALMSLSFSVYSQRKLERVLRELLNKKKNYLTENTFFCDSLYYDELDYKSIKHSIVKKDQKAAKTIIEKGSVTNFEPSRIFTSISDKYKIVSYNESKKMLPDTLILTACEKKAMNVYDSLLQLEFKSYADTLHTNESKASQDIISESIGRLHKEECFLSYRKKAELAEKWLVKFYAIYEYKNQYLVSYTYSKYGRVYNAFSEVIKIKGK